MVGDNINSRQYNIDINSTKIFVGGLAWETQRDTMRRYFEQFGEILEAVVITDKNTLKSKGYGFVTFKDPEAAMKACQNPSPIIDGRRANCNIASIGANKNRTRAPQHQHGRSRAAPGVLASPAYHGTSSTFVHQNSGQYTFPNSSFGYTGYSQGTIYPLSCYGVFGGQQISTYYPSNGASGQVGLFPILPRHYGSAGILALPSSMPMPNISAVTTTATTTTAEAIRTSVGTSQTAGTTSEQNSSAESLHRQTHDAL
ncbi:hypothetical protein JHK86_017642 [Glycine max]|nr:hypothetical protein JHK86_017642 [Glycine max]